MRLDLTPAEGEHVTVVYFSCVEGKTMTMRTRALWDGAAAFAFVGVVLTG